MAVQKDIEQTLVLIKPDALKLSLTGYMLSQFSEFHTGLRFAGAKIVHVTRMLAEEHYAEHKGKPFYPSLIEYITGKLHYPTEPQKRRVIALVYCGPDAVKTVRNIAGPTNPHVAREHPRDRPCVGHGRAGEGCGGKRGRQAHGQSGPRFRLR